ncbi:gp53-like domain-containing protein, partial [Pantoea agglomerans]
KYVDDAVIEVKAYADGVMKKHLDADNPHSQYLQIANALAEIKDAGLIADVLKNLGLGDAAKKTVGNDAGQLPDMNFFTAVKSDNGYCRLPNGIILQWGHGGFAQKATTTVTLPIAFPTIGLVIL